MGRIDPSKVTSSIELEGLEQFQRTRCVLSSPRRPRGFVQLTGFPPSREWHRRYVFLEFALEWRAIGVE
jgi:hypothetical protein